MMSYRVSWEIDLDADSPREAAERALEIHRQPDSIATVFTVADETGNSIQVDLEEDLAVDPSPGEAK
jgi:hypothetical protein